MPATICRSFIVSLLNDCPNWVEIRVAVGTRLPGLSHDAAKGVNLALGPNQGKERRPPALVLTPRLRGDPNAVTLVTGVTLFLVSFLYLSYMGRK